MKILHVIAQLPARTGSGVYYGNVVEEFKKYGYEQAALFAIQDGDFFDILDESAQHPVCFKSDNLPFPIVGMSDVMPYDSTVYSSMDDRMLELWHAAFHKALTRAKAEFNPDVVILHHLWMLTSLGASIFDNAIKIGVCHNTDIRQAEQHPELKSKYVRNLHKLDAVFSLSDSQMQKITDTFEIPHDKILTIGGGFNQAIFYPPDVKEKRDTIDIVYAAKIERSKGVFELVRAFKQLKNPNLRLDIVGTPMGENAERLKALIGDADNIVIDPIMCQKVLANLIRKKDIFVMPSFFEGLGLMAIECLACGLRVVSTEVEALMSLLGDSVNSGGVIEYVKLPRIYDTDKPYEEDIDKFIDDLSEALLLQIERIENSEPFPPETLAEIDTHSWNGIAEKINTAILKLTAR